MMGGGNTYLTDKTVIDFVEADILPLGFCFEVVGCVSDHFRDVCDCV